MKTKSPGRPDTNLLTDEEIAAMWARVDWMINEKSTPSQSDFENGLPKPKDPVAELAAGEARVGRRKERLEKARAALLVLEQNREVLSGADNVAFNEMYRKARALVGTRGSAARGRAGSRTATAAVESVHG